MQVASTLWPQQKIRENISTDSGSNGPSVAQEPKQNKSRQANHSMDQTRRPRQAQPLAVGGGWRPGQAGRPIGRLTRPMGPTASTLPRCASLLLIQVGLGCYGWWLPPINTRGGREQDTHTHLTSLTSQVPSCIVFRFSGVQEKSRSHRVAGVARYSGMGSSLALSCNIQSFVIELDYGYRYLLKHF